MTTQTDINNRTPDMNAPQRPKASKGLMIGLAASVLLNLGLVGFIAGRLNDPKGMMMAGGGLQIMKIARHLPEQDRTMIRDSLKNHRGDLKQIMETGKDGRTAIKEALTAEPFDAAKLAAALDANRKHMDAAQDRMQAIMMEIAPKISPEGRQKLASLRQKDAGHHRRGADMMKQRIEDRMAE